MRFWASDHHFGHARISELAGRQFETVEEMNEELIRRHNEVVGENDDVWIVGDFAMGKIVDTLRFATRLNGRLVLLPGNHDRVWPGGRKDWESWIERYEQVGFTVLREFPGQGIKTMVGPYEVTVSHFPPTGDSRDEDRYSAWRPIDDGSVFVHGHTHQHEKTSHNGRYIHVGVDSNAGYPLSEDEMVTLIEDGPE